MSQIEKETPVLSNASNNQPQRRRRRHARRGLFAFAFAFALLGVGAAPAMADLGLQPPTSSLINQNGTPDTQAGSHPWESITSFTFATNSSGMPNENVQNTVVDLPAGLIGNPNATSKCTVAELDTGQCPGSSQLGQLTLLPFGFTVPVYNMVPPAGMPAQFGSNIILVNSFVDVSLVPTNSHGTDGGYALRTSVNNISAALPISGISLTLWGVPADPSHDANRTCAGGVSPCSSGGPVGPFLTTPTSCTGTLTTTVTANSWQSPNSIDTMTAQMPGMTDCGRLSFNPSIRVQPDTTVADSPAGLNVDVRVPQAPDTPTSLATPDLQNATVTLPRGIAVNPASADGLQACAEAQIGLNNASQPTCPDASKIGTAEIDSPIQADPLTGSIYLAQQNSNPFGSLLAIYVAVQSDGVLIKLAAELTADPTTGQLTTSFTNNPQLPFSDFKLDFFGGPRAALVTPDSCGIFTTTSSLAPWSSGAAATPTDSFTISSGCVGGFSPTFTAGVSNPQAGASPSLGLSLSRSDTDQEISGLRVVLPPGLLAKLGNVPLCSDADANAGTCPASAQVGTAEVGAGAGTNPFFLLGNVYLTGPYKGGQFGLVVVVPAIAGPLNLGTVVVRQSIQVDPTDAHVTVVSDPFPSILDGIPLHLRRVDVTLNRPGFMLNPTSCNPTGITGALTSTGGLFSVGTSRFQVGGCQRLGFRPTLKITLSGRGRTTSGTHPTLTANLTQPGGQSNLTSARVMLPLSLALDPTNSSHVCSYNIAAAVHGGAVRCPASTIVGKATAVTPLLATPLAGAVYLVQGIRFGANGQQIRTLPSLLVPLRGQIALDLRARTSVSNGHLVTTFSSIPDAPVSAFRLTINGGPKGLLVITGRGLNICKQTQQAIAIFGAQSGKSNTRIFNMGMPCGPAAQVRVLSHFVSRDALVLRVRTSERGRLIVTGRGLRRFSWVLWGGVHQVRVALVSGARPAIVTVNVTLDPANAPSGRRTFRMRA